MHLGSWVLGIITKTNTKIDINININNQSLKKTKRTRRGNDQTFSEIYYLSDPSPIIGNACHSLTD